MRKRIVWLALGILCLAGCSALSLPSLVTPKKPETVYNWQETTSEKPQAVVCGDGKVVVVTQKERSLTVGLEQTTPKLTFAQKVGNMIGGMGMIGVILLILGLVLAPGATIGFLRNTVAKWKKALKETVAGINDAKAVETHPELKNSLSARQDLTTKKLIDKIKREL